jgi:hypothetical protein
MSRHTSKNKLAGGVLLGAIASGALAVAALSGAATASAGCVSISGQTFFSGGGGDCETSTDLGNIAIANGTGAKANSKGGPGNTAIAAGTGARSGAVGGGNFALANGNPGPNNGFLIPVPSGDIGIPPNPNESTFANAEGFNNTAFAIGDGSIAVAQNLFDVPLTTPGNNRATTIGNGSNSAAISGNLFTPPIPAGQIANAIGNNVYSVNMP